MSTPASLTLVLLAASIAGALSAHTTGQETAPIPPIAWPPTPDRIVNVAGEHTFGRGESTHDIFSVPDDSWFVVTDFRRIETGNLDPELDLMMRRSGEKKGIVVLYHEFSETSFGSDFGGPVGLRFAPSSTVVLQRNEPGSTKQPSRYSMVGYLVAAE